MEVDTGCRIDPVADLVEIGQCAEATRDQLLRLTIWLIGPSEPMQNNQTCFFSNIFF